MKHVTILLDTFEKIKKFVNIAYQLDYELDLISGRYVVDGKSIIGIFSLDLSRPIEVRIFRDMDQCPKELEEFIYEE